MLDIRKLEYRVIQNVEVGRGFYPLLNQNNILDNFTSFYPIDPFQICFITLKSETKEISLKQDIKWLEKIIRQETIGIWQDQYCRQFGNFRLDIPINAQKINNSTLAHLFAHILLPYASRCCIPWISRQELAKQDFDYQELYYHNQNNELEVNVAYNFPARLDDIAKFGGIILDHFNLWISGRETHSLIEELRQYSLEADRRFITE